jgi:integrase
MEDTNPVRDFRVVWKNGCVAAGVPDLLFHDLRRSGARGLIRAGVSPHHAAMITGHKTLSLFNRYDIIDERDIADAVDKLERHQKSNLSPISVPTPTSEPAHPEAVPPKGIQ